jgi:threonine dehydratase
VDVALPTPAGIERAHGALAPGVRDTPLVRSELLSRALDADVWLKNETVGPVASFKARGALTAVLRGRDRGAVGGAVTSSTGNHGQGVAYAARAVGWPAHIFLPEGANPVKRMMIEAFGAVVHTHGRDIDEAQEEAQAFAADEGLLFVDDGESPDLMEGAGTVGLEIAGALDGIDVVFVPIGSGTLAVGVAAAVKGLQGSARVVAVQSKGSAAMVESFHARRAVELPIDTVADGLVCRVPARQALEGLWAFVDDAVALQDDTLLAAMHTLVERGHVLVEPAGAAGLAGAWDRRDDLRGRRVVLILTGSNVTPDVLRRALATPPLAVG